MKYRMLALDLDGTVVHPLTGYIHPTDARAVHSSVLSGVQVVLASARPPRSIKPYWLRLGLESLGVAYNGGLVWSFSTESPVKGWYFEPEKLTAALEIVKQMSSVSVWLESEDKWITELVDTEPVQVHIQRGGPPTDVGDVRKWIDRPINKILIYGDGHLDLAELLRGLDLQVVSYDYPAMAEVRPLEADKGTAFSWICQHVQIPLQQTVSIGDDSNDLPLFAVVDLSIAMGNAKDTVQASVDRITLGIEKQGVAFALNRYVLGRQGAVRTKLDERGVCK